jgi:hypothetical protein
MADDPLKEYHAFTSLVDKLLTVPKERIHQRMAEHRQRSAENPTRRGPKPKAKTSAKKR